MAIGAGKYDDLCTIARHGARVDGEGGVILIVVGGAKGSGFSVQADLKTMAKLPSILEIVAAEIRAGVPS